MKYRYPGIRSFTHEEGLLFFGRKNDEERLYKLARLEKIAVLYGKSGYGKSSLLQAAVLPRISRETDFVVIQVRFGYFSADSEGLMPIAHTTERIETWAKLQNTRQTKRSYLDLLIPNEGSLWYHLKKAQAATGNNRFVLVFDQFEEVFSYSDRAVLQFRAQLADLLYVQIPQNFRNAFDNLTAEQMLDEVETDLFFDDLEVKVLFSIRSDFMHLLNHLKDFLPQILRHCYELDALSIEQAKEAITEPAQYKFDNVEHAAISPTFNYSEETLHLLLNFLSKNGMEKVESFQLQLICRHIEEKFVHGGNKARIELNDFGKTIEERLQYLQSVNRNYYRACIYKLPPSQQQVAGLIVENELVTVEDKRRITADAGMLVSRYRDRGATPALLEALKDTYLLRAETTARGPSYELSHDALVEPILNARKERESLEARSLAEQKRRRFMLITVGSLTVAAISLGALLIAFLQFREATRSRSGMIRNAVMAQFNNANNWKVQGKYTEALQQLREIEQFSQEMNDEEKISAARMRSDWETLRRFMADGDTCTARKAYLPALLKYDSARQVSSDIHILNLIERTEKDLELAFDRYSENGKMQMSVGQYRLASENFKKALELKPDDADTRRALHNCLSRQ
ncbi:MAG: ATP-binding protein [Phycisphaerae bacterium]|nr:ATP-binding protein [Saprospiraceae bacterium]